MSSILRAMKKAEQTAAAGRFPGARADSDPAAGTEGPRGRPTLRTGGVAAVILAMAAVLWGGIYFSRPAQNPGMPPAVETPRPAVRQPVAGGLPPGSPGEVARPAAAGMEGAGSALSQKPPPGVSPPAAAAPPRPAAENQPAGLPQPDAAPTPGDKAGPPAAAQVSSGPPAPTAKRPALTLEGIVWSDDPKGRMAVINGKMVREGDLILGVRIQTIGENDVAVAADGDRWTVRF